MQIKPDAAQLRALLRDFNDLPPKVKTNVRRDLRRTGDDVIGKQRAILDGPLPPGVDVTGKKKTVGFNPKTGKYFTRDVNKYADKDVKNPGRSSGMRERIKAGLATRVVTGTTRQSIEVRTQNSKATMSTGYNAKRFRHPVFGGKVWVYQGGMPYFFKPVFEGRADMIAHAIDILNDAVEGR